MWPLRGIMRAKAGWAHVGRELLKALTCSFLPGLQGDAENVLEDLAGMKLEDWLKWKGIEETSTPQFP